MTHAELVRRGSRWARGMGCRTIVTRATVMCSEQPDVLGFNATGTSFLVECKASRRDFWRDRLKTHRRGAGMGSFRYYLVPDGLVQPVELGVDSCWGLLWATGRGVRLMKPGVELVERHWREELRFLLAHVRRLEGQVRPLPLRWGCLPDVGL